jgi:hypothetical protein
MSRETKVTPRSSSSSLFFVMPDLIRHQGFFDVPWIPAREDLAGMTRGACLLLKAKIISL